MPGEIYMSKYILVIVIILVQSLFSGCSTTNSEILIRKYDTQPGEYSEITEEELKEYPALEKAISGEECAKLNENNWSCKISTSELSRIMDFTKKKRHKYLFSMDNRLEKDLNRGIVTEELKNEFESKGFQLSNVARQARQLSEIEHLADGYWEIGDQRYKIWKEDGKLNIYDSVSYYPFFKIGENYYDIAYRVNLP